MSPDSNADPLRDAAVLIVEDDYMVAHSLEFLLNAHGCRVVGMAPTVEAALALAEREAFDVAILDVHLRGGSVAPFAEELARRGHPFVFLTGYADLEALPDALRRHPRLDKPVAADLLVATLARLIGAKRAKP